MGCGASRVQPDQAVLIAEAAAAEAAAAERAAAERSVLMKKAEAKDCKLRFLVRENARLRRLLLHANI